MVKKVLYKTFTCYSNLYIKHQPSNHSQALVFNFFLLQLFKAARSSKRLKGFMSHFLKSLIGPNLCLEFNESKHLDLYRGSRRRWRQGVPYLRLRLLSIHVDTLSLEFDSEATMGVDIELVGENRWGKCFQMIIRLSKIRLSTHWKNNAYTSPWTCRGEQFFI